MTDVDMDRLRELITEAKAVAKESLDRRDASEAWWQGTEAATDWLLTAIAGLPSVRGATEAQVAVADVEERALGTLHADIERLLTGYVHSERAIGYRVVLRMIEDRLSPSMRAVRAITAEHSDAATAATATEGPGGLRERLAALLRSDEWDAITLSSDRYAEADFLLGALPALAALPRADTLGDVEGLRTALEEDLRRRPCERTYDRKPVGWTCLDSQREAVSGEGRYADEWRATVASGSRLCFRCKVRAALAAPTPPASPEGTTNIVEPDDGAGRRPEDPRQ